MKTLIIILFALSFNLSAAELVLEQGETTSFLARPNYYAEAKYSAIGIRSDNYHFIELLQGGWYGDSDGRFVSLSYGARSKSAFFVEGTIGYAHFLQPPSIQLDGADQFNLSAGIGYRYKNTFVLLKLRHFSNGGNFTNKSKDDNHGIDFRIVNFSIFF